ncbi:hypothetical protein [Oryzomonas rubra]|uniref:BACON domain-containing protein n=1 Tax=Oryzomonas rubra TaxID=2509454 RepID=A0A5A9X522_9BACT|nr:hypothetical protein [Oryzomonas rubra]KAA0888090.1 hypothetical protein ET418_16960 [Oryzomonas rubra]
MGRIIHIISIIIGVMLAASAACASTGSMPMSVTVSAPAFSVTKNSDMSVNVSPLGQTSFADTDVAWLSATPAKFGITSDWNIQMNIIPPPTIILSNGADTATITVLCRFGSTSQPLSKTDGVACGVNTVTQQNSYVTLFPTSITFSSTPSNGGKYTGASTLGTEYY